MMNIIVVTSTVADGSMFQNNDPENSSVIALRKKFLDAHGISID